METERPACAVFLEDGEGVFPEACSRLANRAPKLSTYQPLSTYRRLASLKNSHRQRRRPTMLLYSGQDLGVPSSICNSPSQIRRHNPPTQFTDCWASPAPAILRFSPAGTNHWAEPRSACHHELPFCSGSHLPYFIRQRASLVRSFPRCWMGPHDLRCHRWRYCGAVSGVLQDKPGASSMIGDDTLEYKRRRFI